MKFHARNLGFIRSLLALSVSLAVVTSSNALALAFFSSLASSVSSNTQAGFDPIQSTGGLLSANAVMTEAGVRVEWSSEFERDNLGFNLYRLKDGKRIRINREIIPGSVFAASGPDDPRRLLSNGSQNFPQGSSQKSLSPVAYSYAWFDPTGTASSIYYVESVGVEEAPRLHEAITPVSETPVPGKKVYPVDDVRPRTSEITANAGEDPGISETSYPAADSAASHAAAVQQMSASTIQDQWSIAAQTALKIAVGKDGWYRVTQSQMAAAGFTPSVDVRNLQLFVDGQEVAINTSQSGGQLGPSDYVEFFGRGLDVLTSGVRTYYLVAAASPGKRVRGEIQIDSPGSPSPPAPSPLPSPTGSAPKSPWSVWQLGKLVITAAQPLGMPVIPLIIWRGEIVKDNSTSKTRETSTLPKRDETETVSPITTEAVADLPGDTVISAPAAVQSAPEQKISRSSSRKQRKKKRLRRKGSEPKREYSHAVVASTVAPSSFAYTVERKDRTVYFSGLLNGDQGNFFGGAISSTPNNKTINVTSPALSAAGPARLEIRLQGVSFDVHQVSVQVNGGAVGSLTFYDRDNAVQTFDVPVSLLQEGINTLTFSVICPPAPQPCPSISLLDHARLTYPRQFRAEADALKFNLLGTQSLQVDGFTNQNVLLIDYTDPSNVGLTKPAVTANGGGYAITVPAGSPKSKTQRLLYATAGAAEQPAAISLSQPSTLNLATNAADFLIITTSDFIPSFTANVSPINTSLVAQRQSQGRAVAVVDVEDIYDEFSYGVHGPQAIKDFLARASTLWATKPRYVIFAGDATYDPRNYEGHGNFDFVPTKLVDATYNETASDDWLADFNNDGVADIPVGRLPVRNPAEASLVISKIVNYAPANVPQAVLLVADDPGTPAVWDFETSSDNVEALLPPSIAVDKSYRRLEIKLLTGTISADTSSNTVTGAGTLFQSTAEIQVGTQIAKPSGERLGTVASIASNTSLTLQANASSTYAGAYGKQDNATATAHIIAGFNQGKVIVNYSGHGNVNVWTGANVFNSAHATALTNDNKLSFVVVMDCLNGYYHAPTLLSLSEAFLKAPNGGAVAAFASSGLTTTYGQRQMELELYEQLYGAQSMALGDAIKIAKAASSDIDVRRTWIFFGDPSLKIR